MRVDLKSVVYCLISGRKTSWSLIAYIVGFLFLCLAPLFVSSYAAYLVSYIMILALVAGALNITFGYGGMLHLQIAVFFGAGSYTTSLLLTKSNLSPWLCFAAAPLVALVLGICIGVIVVRVKGVYFGLLTIALGELVWAVVYRWRKFTGGDDGIHGLRTYLPDLIASPNGKYYFILVVFACCFVFFYFLTKSPFILTMVSYRDNPLRLESIGVNVNLQRLVAFCLSSFFAGVGGALYVTLEGSVYPSLLGFSYAAEFMIMCILGGMGTFVGPYIGAAIMGLLTIYLGIHFKYWLLILGMLLLVTIVCLPRGIVGYLEKRGSMVVPLES